MTTGFCQLWSSSPCLPASLPPWGFAAPRPLLVLSISTRWTLLVLQNHVGRHLLDPQEGVIALAEPWKIAGALPR